jgi:ABC-type polysaccharide/polyol phosphate transport system ATPase subunit
MNSTTTFNDKEVVVELEKLNMLFRIDYHPSNSFRDQFTKLLSHPYNFFFQEKERLHVIKDLDLKIYKGDRLGILGVNGAGKSSLCRCISGMYTPYSGKLKVNGNVRAIFSTGIGVLPELTGRENARLIARLLYEPEIDIDKVVEDALEFSELNNFVDTPFKYYSKGMQARLFLSVVSARPSDILILDEVFEGADAYFSQKIAKRLMDMMEQSKAVIFVSHTEEHLRQACNKLIVLNNNILDYEGDVEGGLAHYRNIIANQAREHELK